MLGAVEDDDDAPAAMLRLAVVVVVVAVVAATRWAVRCVRRNCCDEEEALRARGLARAKAARPVTWLFRFEFVVQRTRGLT